ncbi:lipid A biosynthesis lauroyl acyltransferase [Campylobacter magnus]|uniref:lipid A biosynthesis lauroyl acyltransferase n=1 Tax=Campylobacter magnus TaxID=3026462 RepID=UPI0026E09CAB|nr:lipid A biosynthesis lauroyl acyltransferase [Campylobacter magnus]MDO2407517.1 lipid A biosynthesis lauroyl acyltransferase [Campylobacter magnus]
MLDYFYLGLYYALRFLVKFSPKCVLKGFLKSLASAFYYLDKKHTNIMRVNLKMCFAALKDDEIERLIKKNYYNFALFGAEFLLNQNTTKEQILSKISFENEELFNSVLSQNRPIIVQTAHYGNWELFSLAMAARYGAVSIIGRALDSAKMNEILSANRTRFDIELIEKKSAVKQALKALNNRRLLGILVDQNTAKNEGLECEFFSHKIMHTHAASVFASKSGAIIIPAFIERDNSKDDSFKIVFYEPIDMQVLSQNHSKEEALRLATQAQSDATAAQISKKPDEYFWMHKKFKCFYENSYA